ncbi:DUF6691 family protein [Halobacteriovorax sp. JY17]|uniref:DUF6691 family protein n=1 Tax=Halobacteriovorax sp. JY17 TaxID=2014617 RepID=UPI000C61CFEB|nr:DUF6691 family protein [Halobacteriovorax sp. JY17]PIK16418.1 MAG: YeeE/YedE family protein [Halobacteriovorax sp. JY17]
MKAQIISLVSGILFAIGLSISGMINPEKVRGFLDILGDWDYSLVFVMLGAVSFNYFSFKYLKTKKPICADTHFLPKSSKVDKQLISGAVLFGAGWGLLGICPGPAIVNLVTLNSSIIIFILAMLVGMGAYKVYEK